MKKSIIYESIAIAKAKFKSHSEFEHFIHFSFLIQNNQIVEIGKNNRKTPFIHYGYSKRLNNPDYSPKTHSEIDVWRKSKGILVGDEFEIINIRLNKKGELKLSKPCSCCYEILKQLGCKTFYFSSESGFLKLK